MAEARAGYIVARHLLLTCVAAFALAACSNVKGETYTDSMKDKVTSDVASSNLSSDEKREYVAALMRSAFGAYDASNKTVGQIIDDQHAFEVQKAAEAEAQKEADAKAQAAAMAERRSMQDVLSVQVSDKGFQASDPMNGIYQDSLTLGIQFHNRGTKKITEAKGILIFSNHFGDVIYRINIDESAFNGSALARSAIYSSTYTSNYNQFEEDQVKFRSTPLSSMVVQWVPTGISFGDGSTMTAIAPDVNASP